MESKGSIRKRQPPVSCRDLGASERVPALFRSIFICGIFSGSAGWLSPRFARSVRPGAA